MREFNTLAWLAASLAVMFCLSVGMAAEAERHTLALTPTKPAVKLVANVVYAQPSMRGYSNIPLRLDILQPEAKTPAPLVLFITGGGFINANKDNFIQQRLELAEAGYVVASMEYRVAPTVLFPAPLEDVKSAIRYLRANAERFGINPAKVAVFGASAGGYLAAFAGTTNGEKRFDVGEHKDQSSDVQAVVDFYGLSDLTRVGEGYSEEVLKLHASPGATEALWVNGASPFYPGGPITQDLAKAAAANPMTYISERTPPFLIMHGDKDMLVSPKQTERLHDALAAKGIETTYYTVKDAGHGGIYWLQPEVMKLVIEFFNKHLGS